MRSSKKKVLSKVGQGRVDRLQGNQLGIKMHPRPCAQLLVLGMASISQRFKQVFIAANAAAILGRARPRSIQTARRKAIRSARFDLFYRNHMLPPISKIVFVDKAGTCLTSDTSKSYTSITFHAVVELRIWLSAVRGAYDELVQMLLLPPHDDRDHPVHANDRPLTRNHHTSPDRWFNVSKTNMQLIDDIG